jgi:hypothetical protein
MHSYIVPSALSINEKSRKKKKHDFRPVDFNHNVDDYYVTLASPIGFFMFMSVGLLSSAKINVPEIYLQSSCDLQIPRNIHQFCSNKNTWEVGNT